MSAGKEKTMTLREREQAAEAKLPRGAEVEDWQPGEIHFSVDGTFGVFEWDCDKPVFWLHTPDGVEHECATARAWDAMHSEVGYD